MPNILLDALKEIGSIPRRIDVDNALMYEMLSGVAEALGIKLTLVESVDLANELHAMINNASEGMFTEEGSALMDKIMALGPDMLTNPEKLTQHLTEDERNLLLHLFTDSIGLTPDELSFLPDDSHDEE